jgi:hypothetical protein
MDIVLRRRPVSIPILPLVALALLIVLGFVAMRVGRIQGNEVGILVNNVTGTFDVRTEPGALIYNGLITDFYLLDNTVQTIRMVDREGVNIKTVDGADVTLDVELNYRLLQDPTVLRKTVIPECGLAAVSADRLEVDSRSRRRIVTERGDAYKAKWVRDYARAIIRYKFGELKTDRFYDATERDNKARESIVELNRMLNPHGLEVRQVIPDRFRFYEEYEQKITEKKEADQEAQSQREKARAALEDQIRQEAEAVAQARVEIERAKGELRKDLLFAEAEAQKAVLAAHAYAYTTRTEADAMLFSAENRARSVLAMAEAGASGIRALVASLAGKGAVNLVKLEYARVLANARLSGVPFATDPVIQKVDVSNATAAAAAQGGKQ